VLPRQAHGGEFANLIVRPRIIDESYDDNIEEEIHIQVYSSLGFLNAKTPFGYFREILRPGIQILLPPFRTRLKGHEG